MALRLPQKDLAAQQAGMMKRLRQFWLEGHLCDLILKSQDGTEHRAHRSVLSAGSCALQSLLSGAFCEGEQIGSGKPVEISASAGAVAGMLDYVYGGEPEVAAEDALELLRLADAYGLSDLAGAAESQLIASLNTSRALGFLRQASTLASSTLLEACEDQIAGDFEVCARQATFLDLSPAQLARMLHREDLQVTREEYVLEGLYKWLEACKDRSVCLGPLLQLVDLPSLSQQNLQRIREFAQSLGPKGHELQYQVDTATRRRRQQQPGSQPKRRCLTHWSPELGAHTGAVRVFLKDQLKYPGNFCARGGFVYIADDDNRRILQWKPGTDEVKVVAGHGAQIHGVNDLGSDLIVTVSADKDIVVADKEFNRICSFRSGCGRVLLEEVEGLQAICFSPSGILYILDAHGCRVQRFDGANLHPLVGSLDPDNQTFCSWDFTFGNDDVIWVLDACRESIFRFTPGGSVECVFADCAELASCCTLSLVEDMIYVVDPDNKMIYSLSVAEQRCQEVLDFASVDKSRPIGVFVQDGYLYVLHAFGEGGFVSQHVLPLPIDLKSGQS